MSVSPAIPRRVACDGRSGFVPPHDPYVYRVFIDGDMKRGVNAFDLDEGWIEIAIFDDNGKHIEKDGDFFYRRCYGDIIVLIKG